MTSWISQEARRSFKCSGVLEILAVEEAVSKGKVLEACVSVLPSMHVPLWVTIDSKDLYSYLPTQQKFL